MAEASSPERLAGRHSGRFNGGSEQPRKLAGRHSGRINGGSEQPRSSLAGIQGESSTRKFAADILVESFRVVFHQDSRRENLSGAL